MNSSEQHKCYKVKYGEQISGGRRGARSCSGACSSDPPLHVLWRALAASRGPLAVAIHMGRSERRAVAISAR